MSIYTARDLTTDEDFQEAHELVLARLATIPENKYGYFRNTDNLNRFFQQNKLLGFVGAYNDKNELVAFLRYSLLTATPSWVINFYWTKPGAIYLHRPVSGDPGPTIMEYLLKKMEEKNIFTWYYVRRLSKAWTRNNRDEFNLLRCCSMGWDEQKKDYRYILTIDEVIKKGTTSKFGYKDPLFVGNTPPVDMIVMVNTLKQEYRPWADILVDEENYKD